MAVFIVRRQTKSGVRFHVRWQESRYAPQVHLGSFDTLKRAKARREWALDELAAGRAPDRRVITRTPTSTIRGAAEAWLESRVDLRPGAQSTYHRRLSTVLDVFGDYRPSDVTVEDVQQFVVESDLAARTIGQYVNTLAQILDHAGVEPNPARDRKLRLPKHRRTRVELPTRAHLAALYAELPEKYRSVVAFIEATGVRVSEAVNIAWSDVHGDRILISDTKTAAGTRWIEYPHALLPAATPGSSRVYPYSTAMIRHAITHACQRAGIPHYHPHDLRHLHASRRIHAGESPLLVAEALGHSSPATTLRTYAHVVPPD